MTDKYCTEGVDGAGGSQACGDGRGEGDGGATVSASCVRDAGGTNVAAVVESFAGSMVGDGRSSSFALLLSRRQHRTWSWPILMPQSVEEIICQSSHSTSVQVWAFSFKQICHVDVLRDFLDQFVYVYFDDILIYSPT